MHLNHCFDSVFGKKAENTKHTEMHKLSRTHPRQYIDAMEVFDALTEATEEAAQVPHQAVNQKRQRRSARLQFAIVPRFHAESSYAGQRPPR